MRRVPSIALAKEGLIPMHYVYCIRSINAPEKKYTGLTIDLKVRMRQHNAGQSPHKKKYAPWKLEAYFAFEDQRRAEDFEKYLKSGSGHAFAKKHFW
jgi:putative endonuclease